MKKILLLILCLCLAVAWVGCASKQDAAPATPAAQPQITPNPTPSVPGIGWRTVTEELQMTDAHNNGVFAPMWFAFEQDLCRAIDYDFTEETRVRPAGKVYFSSENEYTAYKVEQDSGLVAVIINGQFVAYRKHFNLLFEVGGMEGRLLWSPNLGTDFNLGEKLEEYDGYTVYEAVSLTEASAQELYIVDVTQLLKTSMPELFDSCAVPREFYWMAKPDGLVSGSKC